VDKFLTAVLVIGLLVDPALAFDTRPDLDATEGSVRVDGHSRELACDRSKRHRGSMTADRRDEVLLRYGLPAGAHPDYEIDHLIPLCLGGSDGFLKSVAAAATDDRGISEGSAGATPLRNGVRG
jgi:hypothetical protein